MTQPIVYIDTSRIREGKRAELKKAMKKLTAFVDEHVPRLLSYGFYLNEDQTQMTVVAIHPDSESIEYHMDVGKEEFKKFSDYIELLKIEIYGNVSEPVLERLHKKANMLGNATVSVHEHHAGFDRQTTVQEA